MHFVARADLRWTHVDKKNKIGVRVVQSDIGGQAMHEARPTVREATFALAALASTRCSATQVRPNCRFSRTGLPTSPTSWVCRKLALSAWLTATRAPPSDRPSSACIRRQVSATGSATCSRPLRTNADGGDGRPAGSRPVDEFAVSRRDGRGELSFAVCKMERGARAPRGSPRSSRPRVPRRDAAATRTDLRLRSRR